jgi:arsenate reductase (thioredoxin)
MKILFVCRGNVGRSQMAEVMFNKLAAGKHHAFSAGTWVYDKEGNSKHGQKLSELKGVADECMCAVRELGLDMSENQRDQLTPEMLQEADRVIVMAEEYSIPDYLKQCSNVTYWTVEDPKGMNQEDTNKIRDQIKGLVEGLVAELG